MFFVGFFPYAGDAHVCLEYPTVIEIAVSTVSPFTQTSMILSSIG